MSTEQVLHALKQQFPEINFDPRPLLEDKQRQSDQIYTKVPPDQLIEVMTFLRHDRRAAFEQLCDLTCVDYLNYPDATDRYAVVYSLLSLSLNHRLWVKCFVNDPKPEVPSVTGIWNGANWMEREVYDLFGISFTGHPDLRRILTWEGFSAHPLRKDYPLRGRGERENYPVIDRETA
jgi:NADH-quinone oxidoreductase subunit C